MSHPANHTPYPGAGTPTTEQTPEDIDRAFAGLLDRLVDVRTLSTEQILTDVRDLREAIGTTRLLRDIMGTTGPAWFDTRLARHQKCLDDLADMIECAAVDGTQRIESAEAEARHAFLQSRVDIMDAETRVADATQDAKGTRHEAAMRAYTDHRAVVGWRIVSVLALAAGVLVGVAL